MIHISDKQAVVVYGDGMVGHRYSYAIVPPPGATAEGATRPPGVDVASDRHCGALMLYPLAPGVVGRTLSEAERSAAPDWELALVFKSVAALDVVLGALAGLRTRLIEAVYAAADNAMPGHWQPRPPTVAEADAHAYWTRSMFPGTPWGLWLYRSLTRPTPRVLQLRATDVGVDVVRGEDEAAPVPLDPGFDESYSCELLVPGEFYPITPDGDWMPWPTVSKEAPESVPVWGEE